MSVIYDILSPPQRGIRQSRFVFSLFCDKTDWISNDDAESGFKQTADSSVLRGWKEQRRRSREDCTRLVSFRLVRCRDRKVEKERRDLVEKKETGQLDWKVDNHVAATKKAGVQPVLLCTGGRRGISGGVVCVVVVVVREVESGQEMTDRKQEGCRSKKKMPTMPS